MFNEILCMSVEIVDGKEVKKFQLASLAARFAYLAGGFAVGRYTDLAVSALPHK